MLIKAPGIQRKKTFANHCQGFHNVTVLLENTVLFHSSHHSTSCRDTGSCHQCHHGKTCPVKTPLSVSQAIQGPLHLKGEEGLNGPDHSFLRERS